MIGVKRPAPPSVLLDPHGAAAEERANATRFKPTKTQKSFPFRVYGYPDVRVTLERAFGGKCAYCESYYADTQPVDVEHWRPKARVDVESWEQPDFPGYPWLASEWSNLLPSCIDCNRRREHRIEHSPSGERHMTGKGSRFPVEHGTARATGPEELSRELPLLIDPCRDDPTQHLGCSDIDPSIIVDLTTRGEVSIEVFGLNRAALVTSRRERLHEIRHHLYQFAGLLIARERTRSQALQDVLDDLIQRELRILARFRSRTQPYSMMSARVIGAFMDRITRRAEAETSAPSRS